MQRRSRAVAKKASKKKVVRFKGYAAAPRGKKVEAGFVKSGAIYVPESVAKPIAPSKLEAGLKTARNQIQKMVDTLFLDSGSFELREIKMNVSFSADGKFLGIGVGGAASITITIAPKKG